MMRAAAKAIKSGMIPLDIVPPSYSVVYQITTLTDTERQQAVEEGVIRLDMRGEDIAAFKNVNAG
jgi:hypothetical protein